MKIFDDNIFKILIFGSAASNPSKNIHFPSLVGTWGVFTKKGSIPKVFSPVWPLYSQGITNNFIPRGKLHGLNKGVQAVSCGRRL